jgi:hypothetical protein
MRAKTLEGELVEIPDSCFNSSFLKRMHLMRRQESVDTCGQASIRNSVALMYGLALEEVDDLWARTRRAYRESGKPKATQEDDWTDPAIMSLVIKYIGDSIIQRDLKVLSTRKGDKDQLVKLTSAGIAPIIHRPFHETGVGGCGHYEVVVSCSETGICLYNSFKRMPNSGFYLVPDSQLKKWWSNPRSYNDTWFLIFFEQGINPKEKGISGRYL